MELRLCRLLRAGTIIAWILALLTNLDRSLPLITRLGWISALRYTDRCVNALAFRLRCDLALVCSLACAALSARDLDCICAPVQDAGWGLCCSRLSTLLLLPLEEVPYPLDQVLLVPFTRSMLSGWHDAHSTLLLQGT